MEETATQAVSAATEAVTAAADALSAATQVVAPTGIALVLEKLYFFVMVPLVYLSIAFFIVAVVLKVFQVMRAPAAPYQLAIYPERKRPVLAALGDAFGMGRIRERKPRFWAFLMVYHAGFLLLILAHLDMFPALSIVNEASRHMLGAGLAGLMVTVGALYFLARRFKGMDRQISVPADYLLLMLLLAIFLLGDMISWSNSWAPNGFVMTKADFRLYFGSLAGFSFADPRQFLHGSHYHFVVLHVFLSCMLFFVLPFTKVMHAFFAIPLNVIRRSVWKRR